MGQEETKQKEQISEQYTIVKTIAPGEYWVRKKNKGDQLLLRVLSFYIQEEMEAYVRILEKRKKLKNPHLLELIEHTRISEQNMCSSMFKIRTVVEYPFKTVKDQIAERSLGSHKSYFNEDELWSILYSCCHALYSLYINKFYHECLNTKQIFIDTSGLVKIADSVLVSSIKNYLSLMNEGQPEFDVRYISPELVNLVEDNNFYFYQKQKSDVFILGMIMLEIANLAPVDYYNSTTKKFNFDAYLPVIGQLRQRYSQQLCQILEKMLVMDFKERPRLEEIINNIEQKTIYTGSSGNTSFHSEYQDTWNKETNREPFAISFTEPKSTIPPQNRSTITNLKNPPWEQLPYTNTQTNFNQVLQPVITTQNIYPPSIPNSQQYFPYQNNMIRFPSVAQPAPQPQPTSQSETKELKFQKWSFEVIMKDIEQNLHSQKKIDNNYTPYQELVGLTTVKESSDKANGHIVKRQSSNPVQKPNIAVRFSTGGTTHPLQQIQTFSNRPLSGLPFFESTEFERRRFSETKFGGIELQNKIEQPQQIYPGFQKEKNTIQNYNLSNQNSFNLRPAKDKSLDNVARKIVDSSPELPLEPISQFVIEESPNGKYEGFVLAGKRNGVGKMIYPDGGYYQGKWADGQMCGYGELFYQNGAIAYKGFWNRGMFNGEGTVYNDNPDYSQQDKGIDYLDLTTAQNKCVSYQGVFLDDEKHGIGCLTFTTGETFTGTFVNDKAEGEGEFHLLSGDVVAGIWKDSKFVGTNQN